MRQRKRAAKRGSHRASQPTSSPTATSAATMASENAVLLLLACIYATSIFSRSNFHVLAPSMLQDDSVDVSTSYYGTVSAGGTLAYLTGKLLLGPAVDNLGGRRSIVLALLGSAAGNLLLASVSTASELTQGLLAPSSLVLLGVAIVRVSTSAPWMAITKTIQRFAAWRRAKRGCATLFAAHPTELFGHAALL